MHRPRVHIENGRRGGLWWRVPAALLLWLPIAAPVLASIVVLAVLRDYADGLPRVPDLEGWERGVPRTSRMLAADGALVAELPFQVGDEIGHRLPVDYADLPERLIQAILAAEDVRFFEHRGVDVRAVARAARANYRAGRVVEGASTITQQVARNLLPDEIGYERTLRRKVREALLARRIDARYDKHRILEVYANHVFLGAGAYGVAAAARAYFSKPVRDLDLPESALLAGLIQAPGRTDPFKDLDAARARRDQVLERMHRAGFLDEAELRAAQARPIALRPPPIAYGTLAPWHTEWSRRLLEETEPNLYHRGGLIIETAANPTLSLAAEAAARAWSSRLGKGREHGPPQIGALVLDHRTGYVEATVGGLDWGASRFDRATQACRQPGSAFKPLVFAAALAADRITPGTPLRDAPLSIWDDDNEEYWKPRNSGRGFRGVVLAHDALVESINVPAIDVLERVGGERVIELARRLGVSTPIANVRPMALGASCVIPAELARAYATIARRGRGLAPVFTVRVRRDGDVLVDHASPYDPRLDAARRLDRLAATAGEAGPAVLDEATAWQLSAMLRDVVRRGTARDARRLTREVAGKTGTTNENTDAWFVGYTGRVTAAVWVGHDDPTRTLGPKDNGGRAALPLWMELVELADAGHPPAPVPGEPPPGLERHRIDRETGRLARPGAGGAVELYFKPRTAPTSDATAVEGAPVELWRVSREF